MQRKEQNIYTKMVKDVGTVKKGQNIPLYAETTHSKFHHIISLLVSVLFVPSLQP